MLQGARPLQGNLTDVSFRWVTRKRPFSHTPSGFNLPSTLAFQQGAEIISRQTYMAKGFPPSPPIEQRWLLLSKHLLCARAFTGPNFF